MGNTGAALQEGARPRLARLRLRVWLGTLLTLALALFGWWEASQWYQTRLLTDQRAQAEGRLIPFGNALSGIVTRRLALLDALTAFVQAEPSDAALQTNFPVYATGLSAGVPGIRAIELAPDGVIHYVYPLVGNGAVLGQDLFNRDDSPIDYAAVQQALVTREPVVTGPLELAPGDLGATAQQAIYHGDQLWGVARVVLEVPLLLAEANLDTGAPDLDLALRRSNGEIFFGPQDVFTADPVVDRIDLVEGGWELAAIPHGGWHAAIYDRLLLFQGFGLLIAGLVTSLVFLTVNRQTRLALAVQQRTEELARLNTALQQDIARRERVEEELKQASQLLEQRVRERTRELSTLLETSNTIAATLELQPLLRVVLDQLKVVVRYTGATIFFLENEDLIVLGHSGPLSAEQVAELRAPAAQSVSYHEIRRRGGPLIVDDVWADSPQARASRESALAARYAVFDYAHSLLLVPLIVRERLVGLVRIDHNEPHFYTERDAQLALAFANQAAAAIENARLYDQARDLATIEERQRLARDLHDAVTQTLFSASLIAEALPDAWRQSPAKAQRGVEELGRLTRGALAEMRTLLLELRPAALAEKPLGELLGALCTAVMSRTRIPIALTVAGDALLAPAVQIAFYRVTQEALNNIAKHALASQVTITGRCDPDQVELWITDDGRGFDPSAVAPGSLGLGIMRERAASIGATLRVESRPGAGTELCMIWQDTLATRAHGGAG
ncbi:MAG: histidine kinase [Roseiflexaceae bacterium]